MKNAWFIILVILAVMGVIFFLVSTGSKKENSTSSTVTNKEEQMNEKQAPDTLPASERVGKKARFETSEGSFTIDLFGDKAPKTVSNFITLAKDGFYNGLIFHRVISGFMIQGGDPQGNGTGGPDYKFEDEFDDSLTFAKPGMLAMANSGPNTNGSQFFITVAATTWLNNKHTVFGQVTEGYNVVEKISKVQVGASDKPVETVTIKKIEII